MQESIVSVRGQTVIPKELREELGIGPGTRVRWFRRDGELIGRPVSNDPVGSLIGVLKGSGTTEDLLEERRTERDREEKALEEELGRWRSTR